MSARRGRGRSTIRRTKTLQENLRTSRCSTGKVCYESIEAAKLFASANCGRAYKCDRCEFWHVSTQMRGRRLEH